MATNRSEFELLLDKWEPRLRKAFLDSVSVITSDAVLKQLARRLERGDIEGALDLLNIDRSAFGRLELAFGEAFYDAGVKFGDSLNLKDETGAKIVFRFGVRNLEAETWLAQHSTSLVTQIVQDQQNSIRLALASGLSEGRGPKSIALDIVGRISRATGRRTGGIVGLTAAQQAYVEQARSELLDGDLRSYLNRTRRDKRFDRTVLKAIRAGDALNSGVVDKMVGRYADRLLQLRGEVLARTEVLTALNAAKNEGMRQAIAANKVESDLVTKKWIASFNDRTRDTHRSLHGQEVKFGETFVSPSGASLKYPGDSAAPASEVINCRCTMELRVDYGKRLERSLS